MTAPHSNRPLLNMVQVLAALRLLLGCSVPHVYLPGYQLGAQLTILLPGIGWFVQGRGAIGDLSHHLFTHNPLHPMFALNDTAQRTWMIWGIIDIGWLINPDWVPTCMTTSPRLNDALFWQRDPARHPMREAHDVQRHGIVLNFYDSPGHGSPTAASEIAPHRVPSVAIWRCHKRPFQLPDGRSAAQVRLPPFFPRCRHLPARFFAGRRSTESLYCRCTDPVYGSYRCKSCDVQSL